MPIDADYFTIVVQALRESLLLYVLQRLPIQVPTLTSQQQALSNASVTDFLIVEYNSVIGGRVAHTTFGAKKQSYTVELGANWVC